ncbi:unnamed protein product [Amaranthus hypochondriacus]
MFNDKANISYILANCYGFSTATKELKKKEEESRGEEDGQPDILQISERKYKIADFEYNSLLYQIAQHQQLSFL